MPIKWHDEQMENINRVIGIKCNRHYSDGRDLLVVIDTPIPISNLYVNTILDRVKSIIFPRIYLLNLTRKIVLMQDYQKNNKRTVYKG